MSTEQLFCQCVRRLMGVSNLNGTDQKFFSLKVISNVVLYLLSWVQQSDTRLYFSQIEKAVSCAQLLNLLFEIALISCPKFLLKYLLMVLGVEKMIGLLPHVLHIQRDSRASEIKATPAKPVSQLHSENAKINIFIFIYENSPYRLYYLFYVFPFCHS